MFVSNKSILMVPLILFISFWNLKPISIIPLNYIILFLFLYYLIIYLFFYKKKFTIPLIYTDFFNIKIFIFFLNLIIYSMCITVFTGNDSYIIFIKILILMFLPFSFILVYFNNYKFNILKYLKYILILSILLHIFFSFVLGHYDNHIGKILVRYKDIGYFSSNELSLYMLFTITIIGWIYFYFYKKNKFMLFVMTFLPLLHFSKSHIVIYLFSILVSYLLIKRKIVYMIIGIGSLYISSVLLNSYYDILQKEVSSQQIQKVLLANKLIYNSDIDLYSFITKVGDGLRSKIIETYSSKLEDSRFIGFGDKAKDIVGDGHDYHNMFFFFHIQYGLISVIGFYGLLLYFLYLGIKKFKYLNFIIVFFIFYIILRSMIITIDPYRLILYLLFLTLIEANLQYYKGKGSNNAKNNYIT